LSLSLKHKQSNCSKKKEEALFRHIGEKDAVNALATAGELQKIIKPCLKDTISGTSCIDGMYNIHSRNIVMGILSFLDQVIKSEAESG
jgi:hypothetical protein